MRPKQPANFKLKGIDMENGKPSTTDVVKLDLSLEHLNVLVDEYKHFLDEDVSNGNRVEVGAAISLCGKKRAIIEKARKREKAAILEDGRKLDAMANQYFAVIDKIQIPLTEKRKKYDTRIEAEKQAKKDTEHLENCIEEAYEENEKVNAELARIAELERKEKELSELKEKQERERLEAENQVKIAQIEREKQAEIDKIKADRDTKEREELERVHNKNKEAEEKARVEAARPEREQLEKFLDSFNINVPVFKDSVINDIALIFSADISDALDKAKIDWKGLEKK